MTPSDKLLSPDNHALVLIDFEAQMAFATSSTMISELRTNVGIVCGASKIFNVPTVITTVAEKTFSGPVFPEIEEFFPITHNQYIDRSTMNSWEDEKLYEAVTGLHKKKLVLAGLWTSVCIIGPTLSAIDEGYEVYVIADTCGDVSKEAHERAVQRMIQAGATPITAIQYLLELQRDWARTDTYGEVAALMRKYGGSYGLGIDYAHQMLNHSPETFE